MNTPQKAIILAAGLGTRMHPLSFDTPKPLMPVWGVPAIAHILNLLESWGVRDCLVNLHFNPSPIVNYLKARLSHLRISLSFEPEILGTGGVLRRAAWFAGNEPFWMINSDIAAALSPAPLIKEFKRRKTLAALWMEPTSGPRTVEMRAGNIVNFQSSRPGTEGTYTFCGLHLISPAILDFLPQESFFSIIRVYQDAIKAGWRIRGACAPNSFWADLGTPESYLKAHADIRECYRKKLPGRDLYDPSRERHLAALRKRGVTISGFVAIDDSAEIKAGARIENSVIWRGARIGKKAVIENAVIGSDCEINSRVTRLAIKSVPSVKAGEGYFDPQLAIAFRQLNLNPADATILPFGQRGSARSFTRIAGKGKSWIMIRYSQERTENCLYTQHARFLAGMGLNVPEIIADFPQQQLILAEDMGDLSLQQIAGNCSMVKLANYYQQALDSIIILHARGAGRALKEKLTTVPPFSPDLYRWEREYFAKYFLVPYLESGNKAAILSYGRAGQPCPADLPFGRPDCPDSPRGRDGPTFRTLQTTLTTEGGLPQFSERSSDVKLLKRPLAATKDGSARLQRLKRSFCGQAERRPPLMYLGGRDSLAELGQAVEPKCSPQICHMFKPNDLITKIMNELSVIGNRLGRERQVLIHRDLQSSNIIFFRGKPYFIDFQGMRFGTAAYDLASFLCDPYVSLPIDVQLCLLDYYNRRIGASRRVTVSTFWLGAIQRLAQALGAYGFLSASKGTAGFARYIPPALRMLSRSLKQSGICPRLHAVIAAKACLPAMAV